MHPLTRQVFDVLATGEDLHPLHPTWVELSGGVGRLSDHVHHIRRHLRRSNQHLHVLSERRAVQAGQRRAITAVYHLEKSERVSPQLALNL